MLKESKIIEFKKSTAEVKAAEEFLAEIRNKLTVPKVALEKLAKGEKVPKKFLGLALKELKAITSLLKTRIR